MLSVGLTGGIGAGKSEVSRLLAARGAHVIDADAIAREVVAAGTPGLAAVVAEFGADVLRADGDSLDREKLGRIVFADQTRLAALNAIVHPLVGARVAELAQAAERDSGAAGVLVYDVPLLVENQLQEMHDVVVVVDADRDTQLSRLTARRGMSRDDALARIAAQATREQRRAVADFVIDNSGTLADLEEQVAAVWERLAQRAAASAGGAA